MKPGTFSHRFIASLFALLLVTSLVLAQRKAPPVQDGAGQLSINQQDALELLKTLIQELKNEPDKLTAATQQARIAEVLWRFDEPFAREAFRRAFETVSKPPAGELAQAERAAYIARQAASIREVLTRFGTHDQQRAGAWLKTLEEEKEREGRSSESSQFRSDLLMQIALQLAQTNPEQAQRLGLLSLSGGQIPEGFGRLLFALGNVSRRLSNELFRTALATLRRNGFVYDQALLSLINYVLTPGGAIQSPDSLADAQLLANFFVDAAWHHSRSPGESSASFYGLMEVRGLPLVSRYAAERAPELQGQMREMASRLSPAQLENTARLRATHQQQLAVSERSTAADINEQIDRAIGQKDVQVRDALLNSIAHSVMRIDTEKALQVASLIDDADIRTQVEDDVYLVKVQQQLATRSYEDARKTALKIKNTLVQARVLVELASKVLKENKDTGRATQLLVEASDITSKTEPAADKVMAFLVIAQQFAKVDAIRGFETLRDAIKTVNQLTGEPATPKSVLTKPRLITIKTYTVINGSEMSTSDRVTLDLIDFNQVAPFVANDYMQTRLLGNKIENPLRRAKFLTAVASAMLLQPNAASAN